MAQKERKRQFKPEVLLKWEFQKQWKKTPIREIKKEIQLLKLIADPVTIAVAEDVLKWKEENLKSWLNITNNSFKGVAHECHVKF